MSRYKRPEKAISDLSILRPGITIWHSHFLDEPEECTIIIGPSDYSIVEDDKSEPAYIPPEHREPQGSLAGTMWIKVRPKQYDYVAWRSLNDMSCYPGEEYNDNYIFLSYEDWQEASAQKEWR